MESTSTLLCDRIEHGVVQITLNRPEALNALNDVMLRDLQALWATLDRDDTLRAVVLTGQGERAFAAGADVVVMSELGVEAARRFSALGHRVCLAAESLSVPVVAAVNGFALGGGLELALSCDVIYAQENAKFGQPEVKLGLIPGFGGTVRLAERIGPGCAAEWLFSGTLANAEEALRVGLVQKVVPMGQVVAAARAWAMQVAEQGPLAVRAAKRVFKASRHARTTELGLEKQAFASLFATLDAREGMRAFIDKRAPAFQGD